MQPEGGFITLLLTQNRLGNIFYVLGKDSKQKNYPNYTLNPNLHCLSLGTPVCCVKGLGFRAHLLLQPASEQDKTLHIDAFFKYRFSIIIELDHTFRIDTLLYYLSTYTAKKNCLENIFWGAP